MNEEFKYPETMSYQDRMAFEKYLEDKNRPLSQKIWDGIVTVLSYIVGAVAFVIYFVMNIGGCILYALFAAFAFWVGWMFLSGIWNWLF
jgi:VIT1/CCC1 family predicted Fe2+/Mn2+ transporter